MSTVHNRPALASIEHMNMTLLDLTRRDVPPPVTVGFNLLEPRVDVQPQTSDHPGVMVAALLAWAGHLDVVTVQRWHTPSGSVHHTITGHAATGVEVKVYSAFPYDRCPDLITLAPGESETVTLADLAVVLAAYPAPSTPSEVAR